ncbi:feruloyl esterase B [Colletotrichum orchidophilum]|uniref:Feruloyl esterase B n=1 Tax=Colletotrichum orchidophilum TaxID=1209926 RepID=A0A1G4ASY7_9PEZI|nr:feruloyl esterase B [Colletotrichum orchidophilum]OHE92216.1 feruloyl esterase B [Colletotrichum orchidophilum]
MSRIISLLAGVAALALAAELQQITSFGPNPTNVSFYLYVPDSFRPSDPLLVYPHWCHGTAQDAFAAKPWRPLADELGFITIYPSMIRWTLSNYDVDKDRVFVTGISSGAMMTNFLIGSYPELFAAGSAFAGVPFGCYAGDGFAVWNSDCATGQIDRTGKEWAELVHEAYPKYKGPRPKMQVLHGSVDNIVNVTNYYNEIKLWTTILHTGLKPTRIEENNPQTHWTRYIYGRKGLFESFLADGVDHDIPNQASEVVRFFELDCTGKSYFSRKSLQFPANMFSEG